MAPKRYCHYLRDLHQCTHQQRKTKMLSSSDAEIKCICECALNILHGNIPVSDRQKRALARYKEPLRKLANKKRTLKFKRKVLHQVGRGFWFSLLPAAISAITSLFSR